MLEQEVKDFDIVMVYSDGLDDNLYEDDMRMCLEPMIKDGVITSLG